MHPYKYNNALLIMYARSLSFRIVIQSSYSSRCVKFICRVPLKKPDKKLRLLATTNLALGNRPHPCQAHIKYNGYNTHDPENTGVIPRIVAKDDSKDNTTKVPHGANHAGENA
jgi:hypothetical protein